MFDIENIIIYLYLSKRREKYTRLQIFEGSHHRLLNTEKINIISKNSFPKDIRVSFGGIIINKPHLIQKNLGFEDHGNGFVVLSFCCAKDIEITEHKSPSTLR